MDDTATVDTDTHATIPAPEAPAQPPDVDNLAETADTDETPDSDEPGDVFPRSVVEKLRRESAGLRDRAKAAEDQLAERADRLAAVQRQSVDRQISAAGMRPAAVWAVATLDDVLADDGTVDTDKVAAAMAAARQTLGIERRRAYIRGGLHSGAAAPRDYTPGPGFAAAFGPRDK